MIKVANRDFVVSDFETSTEKWLSVDGYARVWLWGYYDIQQDKFEYGTSLDSYMNKILKVSCYNPIIYFHNLKFDGSYIVNWLLSNGYSYDTDLKKANTFETCITDMGLWYYIKICIYKKGKQKHVISIMDSLKKIPLPVRDIPKAFGFENILAKGELDYDTYRPIGHEPTKEELEYLEPDCRIVAQAIKQLESEGFTKMTGSADAFNEWKKSLQSDKARARNIKPERAFRDTFPKISLEVDDYIRRAYRGGWTYVNPKYAEQILTRRVEVWDINSMYPAKMKSKYLPSEEPVFFKGKPNPTKYQCYIVRVMMSFDIKEGYLPTIQLKNSYYFNPTDYITSSEGTEVEMILTNIDLRLIKRHYIIHKIKYLDGYYFRKVVGVFNKHIDKNMEIKERSTGGKRYVAKLRMNTVYGKCATSPRRTQKEPYIDEGVLKFKFGKESIDEPQYTALSVFITAWARFDIITDAQRNYENFIYCDTDSLHMFAEEGKTPDLPIHESHLGYYKKEHTVIKSLFLRSKTYVEQYENGDIEVKCAGASPEVKKGMNFNNFKVGAKFDGKLMPRQVKGGCVLINTTFTIK